MRCGPSVFTSKAGEQCSPLRTLHTLFTPYGADDVLPGGQLPILTAWALTSIRRANNSVHPYGRCTLDPAMRTEAGAHAVLGGAYFLAAVADIDAVEHTAALALGVVAAIFNRAGYALVSFDGHGVVPSFPFLVIPNTSVFGIAGCGLIPAFLLGRVCTRRCLVERAQKDWYHIFHEGQLLPIAWRRLSFWEDGAIVSAAGYGYA